MFSASFMYSNMQTHEYRYVQIHVYVHDWFIWYMHKNHWKSVELFIKQKPIYELSTFHSYATYDDIYSNAKRLKSWYAVTSDTSATGTSLATDLPAYHV